MAAQDIEKINSLAIFNENGQDSADLIEITALIRPHQAFALEILETAEKQRFGKDFDRNKLIQEALDLLIEKHIVAVRLSDNKLAKSK